MAQSQSMIDHPKLRVTVLHGAEGPTHDPYSFTQYHIKAPAGITIYHRGSLGSWLTHNGHKVEVVDGFDEQEAFIENELMLKLTGFTMKQMHRIALKRLSRCRDCGSRAFHCVEGYPGETLSQCTQCGTINTAYFDESAVQ